MNLLFFLFAFSFLLGAGAEVFSTCVSFMLLVFHHVLSPFQGGLGGGQAYEKLCELVFRKSEQFISHLGKFPPRLGPGRCVASFELR